MTDAVPPEDIVAAIPLVKYLVGRMPVPYSAVYDRDDAIQDGCVGLVQEAGRFDPERGVAFGSFAGARIRGEVMTGVDRLDYLSRGARRRGEPAPPPLSLDLPPRATEHEENPTFNDLIPDPQAIAPLDAAVAAEERAAVRRALKRLPERERRIVYLFVVERLGEAEIAPLLGVSQKRVGQLHRQALRRLADYLGGAL